MFRPSKKRLSLEKKNNNNNNKRSRFNRVLCTIGARSLINGADSIGSSHHRCSVPNNNKRSRFNRVLCTIGARSLIMTIQFPVSRQHIDAKGFLFKTTEDTSCRKVTLKGYLERQKATPKRSWPSFNMWRVGSENGLQN